MAAASLTLSSYPALPQVAVAAALLWEHYAQGSITKTELEATLRAHKTAIDATKSSQREEVKGAATVVNGI